MRILLEYNKSTAISMSYYYMLTPAEHISRIAAFQDAFTKDGVNYIANQSIHSLDNVELYKVLDHIGYNIYRVLRMRNKYKENKITLIDYMQQFHDVDHMAAGLLHALPIETIRQKNSHAYDMIQRLLKVEGF